MAASPSSPASSSQLPRSRPASIDDRTFADDRDPSPVAGEDVPVEILVEHLLAAKRSLSSVTLVLRANDLTTHARQLHEEAVILHAHTSFLQRSISEQLHILLRLRKSMGKAYDNGKKEFKSMLRLLDAADDRLESTLKTLRETAVDPVFRTAGEEPKSLIDFVDEKSVDGMRNALKESIGELQAAQTSFDGDLLRFDNDLRALNKLMPSPPSQVPTPDPAGCQPITDLLASLTDHSHAMAEHLTSLTRHFDMCVTAVRTTEGGAALALRKAAEVTQSQDGAGDPVSISGVIAEQESHMSDPEPMTAQERIEVAQVVVQDATEVDEVVAELTAALQQMEGDFAALRGGAARERGGYLAALAAFHALEDMGARLRGYAAAEAEFAQRREAERAAVAAALEQMEHLRVFYEGYSGAYDSLALERERRCAADEKVRGVWRRAHETVMRLVEADAREREAFRLEIGEFLPTDLWVGMNDPPLSWRVVAVAPGEGAEGAAEEESGRRSVSALQGSLAGDARDKGKKRAEAAR